VSEYHRLFIPAGTYFFTLVTHARAPFLIRALARRCLHDAIAKIAAKRPFALDAIVLLPDHLHAIWTLPPHDEAYSVRWKRIKEEFTRGFIAAGGREGRRSDSRVKRKERGVWQRRFWEHLIRDEDDLERHFDYLHYNPVKHGLVASPLDWPYSSFHRWVEKGVYKRNWGSGILDFSDLDESAME
jgi:putative transposase